MFEVGDWVYYHHKYWAVSQSFTAITEEGETVLMVRIIHPKFGVRTVPAIDCINISERERAEEKIAIEESIASMKTMTIAEWLSEDDDANLKITQPKLL